MWLRSGKKKATLHHWSQWLYHWCVRSRQYNKVISDHGSELNSIILFFLIHRVSITVPTSKIVVEITWDNVCEVPRSEPGTDNISWGIRMDHNGLNNTVFAFFAESLHHECVSTINVALGIWRGISWNVSCLDLAWTWSWQILKLTPPPLSCLLPPPPASV